MEIVYFAPASKPSAGSPPHHVPGYRIETGRAANAWLNLSHAELTNQCPVTHLKFRNAPRCINMATRTGYQGGALSPAWGATPWPQVANIALGSI
jgi:hypothetical protein